MTRPAFLQAFRNTLIATTEHRIASLKRLRLTAKHLGNLTVVAMIDAKLAYLARREKARARVA
jgi:hypothetical protein